MSMTLTEVRARVRYAAKNAGDTTSTLDVEIDYAVQDCLDDFALDTRLTRTTTDADNTVADEPAGELDLVVDFPGFNAFRLIAARLADSDDAAFPPLEVIGFDELTERRRCNPRTGRPCAIAFRSDVDYEFYPTPDAAYALSLDWWRPGSNFTAGTGSAGSVTFNVPDDVLRVLCRHGIPSFLQGNMPEYKYAATYRAEYAAFKAKIKGTAAGLGEKTMTRKPAW